MIESASIEDEHHDNVDLKLSHNFYDQSQFL
jgi:hypothetical protein